MKRANWFLLALGFVLVAACGYLLLRDWLNVAAHHVYAAGLGVLVAVFAIINRRLAKSARELRVAMARADESLAAARAAETKYRSLFEDAEERAQRELRHQRCLLELSQFDKSDFGAALRVLVETTSRTLAVARTSAWRLIEKDTEREAIVLLDLFELARKEHVTDELLLNAVSFPRYFAALRCETYIVAHDAATDPRTSEFTESYLRPLGITAMLDVPVFIKGRLAGVLCLEHVGGARVWDDNELSFAAAVGNMIAVTFEAADRRRAEAEADRERERAEQLLLNILPSTIAQRLRRGEGLIADHYTEATVLFADIVDFTRISADIAPQAVVSYLNMIFSEFDQLAQRHGLEKIKTIGDAYMVVGGVPTPRHDHTEAVVEMALAMLGACTRLSRDSHMPLTMRVGINTGPVVAGVIGIRKFIYDLWGDTVNLASRMESHGLTGEIQVSAAVYERMREKYVFEPRGKIEIKGRGQQRTYLLKGRHAGTGKLTLAPTNG